MRAIPSITAITPAQLRLAGGKTARRLVRARQAIPKRKFRRSRRKWLPKCAKVVDEVKLRAARPLLGEKAHLYAAKSNEPSSRFAGFFGKPKGGVNTGLRDRRYG
ncbi:hypothetical protein [Novosphingobium humi]|uniref:Uncharacterized protein n=1 Tax=Novosphingobium humi TaxID=2282397 RepID=A0ABY7TZZ7_9SPHN|nr:hypothetical protein [Novosphingobium humi]WCT78465.1 hypothetical protein PQ457_05720 [Novosphingobium humi]